ncbi:endolysin [Streptomyces sp. NBC_00388]|uniref:endolysin n=1 Tax=Streptomyces sp. NBC_00388 TaxID=2975735 RepID=UPI002E237CB3
MSDLWMPGAHRLDIGDHAATAGGPAKAVAHITWDKNATAAEPADLVPYEQLVGHFGRGAAGRGTAPHLLWDPFTGRFTQFAPATSRSKSLVDRAGGTRTNRAGSVVIQIEALFFPYCRVDGKAYAKLTDTPCKGWAGLNAWVRSWAVPDNWPMGRPADFTSHRDENTWEHAAGWYGHSQVPENDHQDPGSWPAFEAAPTGAPVDGGIPGQAARDPLGAQGTRLPRATD